MKKNQFLLTLFLSLFLIIPSYGEIENEKIKTINNILYVGGNGPNNYTSIQDAIDDASNGDTIFVYSGIYYEQVRIYKSISLIGENEETTIIDGKNETNATVFSIEANNVNFSHFTIRNISSKEFVYGITATGSNITMLNCIIKNADGLKAYSMKNSRIENCNFSNNYWGIFFATDCRDIIVKNCTLSYNLGKDLPGGWYRGGEGIDFMFDAGNFYNISIINCNLSNNRAYGITASLLENLYVKNCIMRENKVGLELDSVKNATILNCEIEDNRDGGIDIKGKLGDVFIKNCNITGTKNWSGIRILNKKSGKIYIEECNIKNNPRGIDAVVWYELKIRNPGGIYVHHSNIYGNKIGIYATRFSIIDARYNYWGSPLGPSHLFDFRGDKIVTRFSKVFYFPWLIEEYRQ